MRAELSRAWLAAGRSTTVRTLLLGLVSLACVTAAAQTRIWEYVENKAFDTMSVALAPRRSSLPITIVGIDEESFAVLRMQWPWPRDLHARLIDKLTEAGAAVIAMDVLFPEATKEEADRQLEAAIARGAPVVLSSTIVYRETDRLRQWLRVDPLDRFLHAGAVPGLAGMALDPDAVPRRVPHYADALWRRTIESLRKARPGLVPDGPVDAPGGLVRYLGPDHTFPYLSYHRVLEADAHALRSAVQDHVVLVGRDVDVTVELGSAQGDTFATPFTFATGRLTPGVEIHATLIENALAGGVVFPAPAGSGGLLLVLSVALAGVAFRQWRPARSLAWLAAMLIAIGLVCAILFEFAAVWLAPVAAMTGAMLMYAATGSLSYLKERRQRREIKLAMSRYVAPEIVEEIAAHPERLMLGGARRAVTLMFTDLEGFTQVSERMSPEEVAQTLNQYFDSMTMVILRHRGTVDKYIGDAVMAFWGAPVDDPAQAEHACRAAIEMQDAMEPIRQSLVGRGLPGMRMRVGIHSGEAVVGNMGSSVRFNYTAMGDDVNLASRLEGVNKLYGTGILVSGATVARAPHAARFRRVDRIRVKGKSKPVDVYTIARGDEPIEWSDAAIDALLRRQWDESERCWRQWLERVPGDTVARIHLERIERLRVSPPEEGWDGSTALEKL